MSQYLVTQVGVKEIVVRLSSSSGPALVNHVIYIEDRLEGRGRERTAGGCAVGCFATTKIKPHIFNCAPIYWLPGLEHDQQWINGRPETLGTPPVSPPILILDSLRMWCEVQLTSACRSYVLPIQYCGSFKLRKILRTSRTKCEYELLFMRGHHRQ